MGQEESFEHQRQAWLKFLAQAEALRRHKHPYFKTPTGPIPNPLLDQQLASLLVIRLAELLNGSLAAAISARDLDAAPNSLSDKLDYLTKQGQLGNAAALQELCVKSNALQVDLEATTSWDDLQESIDAVFASLKQLGVLTEKPAMEYFFEQKTADAEQPHFAMKVIYRSGVKAEGRELLAAEAVKNVPRVGDSTL